MLLFVILHICSSSKRFIGSSFLQLLCHIHLTELIEQRLAGIAKKSVRWYNRRCSITNSSLLKNGEKFKKKRICVLKIPCGSHKRRPKSVTKADTWHGYCIKPHEMLSESISKIVIHDNRSVPIDDFENTLRFPCEETSRDSGLPSHLPTGDVPCPSSPPYGFLHYTIGTLKRVINIHDITVSRMPPARFR